MRNEQLQCRSDFETPAFYYTIHVFLPIAKIRSKLELPLTDSLMIVRLVKSEEFISGSTFLE